MAYTNELEKYLVTGATGQLGHALQKHWGGIDGRAMPRAREALDIADTEQVCDWLPSLRPDAVINCAGYTNVQLAEEQQEACWSANVLGVDNLARVCSERDIPLFHISSDFVFGQDFAKCMSDRRLADRREAKKDPLYEFNQKQKKKESKSRDLTMSPYSEECPVGPLGYYAASKAAGEHAILQHAAINPEFRYFIIRTSGLFERPWRAVRNFPFAIASKMTSKSKTDIIQVVNNVYTNITFVDHLVPAIAWMVENRREFSSETGPLCPKGIYHIANPGQVSWYQVAAKIAERLGGMSRLVPVSRDDYARTAGTEVSIGPSFTCMNLSKYDGLCGPQLPHWSDALDAWCDVAVEYFK